MKRKNKLCPKCKYSVPQIDMDTEEVLDRECIKGNDPEMDMWPEGKWCSLFEEEGED